LKSSSKVINDSGFGSNISNSSWSSSVVVIENFLLGIKFFLLGIDSILGSTSFSILVGKILNVSSKIGIKTFKFFE